MAPGTRSEEEHDPAVFPSAPKRDSEDRAIRVVLEVENPGSCGASVEREQLAFNGSWVHAAVHRKPR
jgi:hypothetical protein